MTNLSVLLHSQIMLPQFHGSLETTNCYRKRAARRAADAARSSAAAEAISAAQAKTDILELQASGGEEHSTDEDTRASAAQLHSKTSENLKMQRKIAELEAQLAEKAKATKVIDELRTCKLKDFLLYFLEILIGFLL